MFKRFIVIAEFSGSVNSLVEDCQKLKVLGAEECLLIQPFIMVDSNSMDISYLLTAMEQNLAAQKAALEKIGFRVESRLLPGVTINEVADLAVKEDYSVIVVGAQKQSLAGSVVFGGLSSEMMYQTKIPVLVLRTQDEDNQKSTPQAAVEISSHILYATDFSENADQAFPYLEQLSASGAKKITLIHIQDRSKLGSYTQEQINGFDKMDMERLELLKQKLVNAGKVQVDIVLKTGSPSVEILKFIDDNGVQLVVMGSQGRGFIKELFLGSVSHNIARQAAASVLLIPKKREDK